MCHLLNKLGMSGFFSEQEPLNQTCAKSRLLHTLPLLPEISKLWGSMLRLYSPLIEKLWRQRKTVCALDLEGTPVCAMNTPDTHPNGTESC